MTGTTPDAKHLMAGTGGKLPHAAADKPQTSGD
jgi:hypothetical protein